MCDGNGTFQRQDREITGALTDGALHQLVWSPPHRQQVLGIMSTLRCRRCLLLPRILLLMTLIPPLTTAETDAEPRFFSHQDIMADFRDGWETAGQFVGLDTSQGVASLVSSSFSPSTAEDKQYPPSAPATSLFHGFFRLLGFDTSKLNAIAVNAVVFIAKMIGSSLIKNFTGAGTGRDKGENEDLEGSPLSWILEDVKTQARSLLSRAQDSNLSEQLMTSLQEVPGETDCIQVLVCRAAPFLSGMQRSLRLLLATHPSTVAPDPDLQTWASLSPLQRMYHYLPSRQDLLRSAKECGRRIPSCSQLFSAFDD